MISLKNLSKSFSDKSILNSVSYYFQEKERIALIGANGQGKTTLLNIIVGTEIIEAGEIIKPKAMRLSILPQSPTPSLHSTLLEVCMEGNSELIKTRVELDKLTQKMKEAYCATEFEQYEILLNTFREQGGYQWENTAEKILIGLGFKADQILDHPESLSGGWRMRLELAKILISNPDFMILDEPTNHLDLPSIEWLESWLSTYTGTLLFVSHDRAFLNHLATRILHLHQGQLKAYTGNFDDFLAQKQKGELTLQATRKNLIAQHAHTQSFVDRFRSKASKTGQVRSRLKQIERIKVQMDAIPSEEKISKLHFPHLPFPISGKQVLNIKQLQVGYQKPLFQPVSFSLSRGQRLAIVGANGLGKSTLLKTLAGKLKSLHGTIHYGHEVQLGVYQQDAAESLDKKCSILNTLAKTHPLIDDQKKLGLLSAFLFKNQDLQKPVAVLSGGEKSRLALCQLLAQLPNCLMLDEPTNHLDLESSEILAQWLQQFSGTVVFISHHRDFLEQVATHMLVVDSEGSIQMS